MGYRSEVAIVIAFKDQAQREDYIALQLIKNNEHTTNALKEMQRLRKTNCGITQMGSSGMKVMRGQGID
jgi:hypothetical protein